MWALLVYREMDSLEYGPSEISWEEYGPSEISWETRSRTHKPCARESLDDVLHHLLPWDIELTIDEPVDEPEEEPEV